MRKATDQRDAQIISLLWTSLLRFHGGDVSCFEVKCFDVLMSVAGSGHVMVTSFDAMCGLCCVMSRDAMRCHGDELYYSSTTLYYKVLLQHYPVLQSTTPVLLCTTKYYSNTTMNYKVLLQYYSVLQSTIPRLLRTTNTTLYYKALLQY